MPKVGNLFQQGGVYPDPNLLTGFLKNIKNSECPEIHNKHIKHFFIFRGVGMTPRNFYNLHFTVWRIYGRAEKNVKGKNKFISKSISWSG